MKWVIFTILGVILIILIIKIRQRGKKRRPEHLSGGDYDERGYDESAFDEDGYEDRRDRGGRRPPPPPPPRDLSNLSITETLRGDQVEVVGAGDDYDDLQFTVDRINRYESGSDEWFEISGKYRSRRVFVEYYEDDRLQVAANTDPTTYSLGDLGITEDDLIRMDEEQRRSNGFSWNGHEWSYMTSHEIGYFRDSRGQGEGYYSWQFECDDGQQFLWMEKWEGEPFEALLGKRIHPDDVKVYRA